MPSPIRFRAFYRGRMLDVFAVNPMNQTVYLSHQQLYDEPGNDVLVPIRSEIEPDGAVLMQWTGLGSRIEVFEGDIVEQPSGLRLVIGFEDAGFRGTPIDSNDYDNYMNNLSELDVNCRVIGNIHQKPRTSRRQMTSLALLSGWLLFITCAAAAWVMGHFLIAVVYLIIAIAFGAGFLSRRMDRWGNR